MQRITIEYGLLKRFRINRLSIGLCSSAGRNFFGRIVVYHRWKGSKRIYRIVDFRRVLFFVPGFVYSFCYDSNRNVYLMLVIYKNGGLSYLIAPTLIGKGSFVVSYNLFYSLKNKKFLMCNGDCISIGYMLIGSFGYNLELNYLGGFKIGRAAGMKIQILKRKDNFVVVRMPSKEERLIKIHCRINIGTVSNAEYKFFKAKKASYSYYSGKKSIVRGVAKNPIDHPHGGGEGRTSGGQPSVSPWGIYAKGVRTRVRSDRNLFVILKERKK